jgi:hypothetical protein
VCWGGGDDHKSAQIYTGHVDAVAQQGVAKGCDEGLIAEGGRKR